MKKDTKKHVSFFPSFVAGQTTLVVSCHCGRKQVVSTTAHFGSIGGVTEEVWYDQSCGRFFWTAIWRFPKMGVSP